MKPLLLLLLMVAAGSSAFAQNTRPNVVELRPGTSLTFKGGKYFIRPLNDSIIVFNRPAFPKFNKPGVYRLPQDNMPCIVPDAKDVAIISNAFKGEIKTPYQSNPPRIPNAVPLQRFQYRTK